MECPECQHENPSSAMFCMACGEKLEHNCPKCGAKLPSQGKFCMECGTRIAEGKPDQSADPLLKHEQRDARIAMESLPDAERRQLTVMFCDLVGSTPLSERLDPEELRSVLREYQSVCAKVIRGLDGHVARYFGDGILVHFGYPTAHEDDAHRAVHAGVRIVEGMKRLNESLQQDMEVQLQVKVGIHTGMVVAGDMDESEQLESMAIIGETPNISARLKEIAEPNTVVISSTTYRLTEGLFDCRSLGSHSLKGISQPMEIYYVLHESAARSRLDAAELTGLTPLMGRKQESALLLERWEQIKDGMGHVVLLGGEAGIGKSRMVKMLKEHISDDPQAWLTECRCSPYRQNTVLHPIVELFERTILQFDRHDSSEKKLNKVEAFIVRYGLPLNETVPLFATFLSIPLGDSYSPLNIQPKQQRQRTIHTLIDVLIQRATQQPVLFVVEDLHWADASSLELLDLLVERGPVPQLLTLFTFRPAFIPPWTGRSHLTYVTLSRLTPRQVSGMVNHIAGKPLPDEVMEQIVGKTDGVPLFVEELSKMILESGLLHEQSDRFELTGPLPPLAIPSTLQDSLMARLDRLSAVKEVAQMGAIIGREFSYELLQAVSPLDDETLEKALAQLVDVELLYQRGLPPQSTYVFKHALIRDASYESLLKSRRQQYHQQIAQVLQENFPETAETQPEIVAFHYTGAGLSQQAIPYWQKAGKQAMQGSANVEAIGHFTQALDLFKNLPETSERIQQEIQLQMNLGSALTASKGYAHPDVEPAFYRGLVLCQKLGHTPQLFPALWGLFSFYFVRLELQTAQELSEQILSVAQSAQEPAYLVEAHVGMGETLHELGELASALEHLERAMALYNSEYDISQALYTKGLTVRDPAVQCLDFMSWTLVFLGYSERAMEKINENLVLARKLNHTYSLGLVFWGSLLCHHQLGRVSIVEEHSVEMIALANKHAFILLVAVGTFFHGWALSQKGMVDEGIAEMQKGLTMYRATGAMIFTPIFLTRLAEALGRNGQLEDGLALVDEALVLKDKTRNRVYEAELNRVRGELMLLQAADGTMVESHFQKAIRIAKSQQAKTFELRAVMSLSRLWQRQGKAEGARKMLQDVYSWFTEGFDTKDLQEAKALLEELSSV